jgi:hypothetical protein
VGYPKITYKPVSGTVTSVTIASNIATIVVANDLLVGELVQCKTLDAATFLNEQVLTVLSATGSQFTAAFTHANYGPTVQSTGSVQRVLTFTYPPTQKPGADDRNAVRHDSVAIAGVVQSITERVEIFKTLNMDFVPVVDLPAWTKFLDNWALYGKSFTYYSDSADASTATDYTLVDTQWAPKRVFFGMTKFTVKMRLLVS